MYLFLDGHKEYSHGIFIRWPLISSSLQFVRLQLVLLLLVLILCEDDGEGVDEDATQIVREQTVGGRSENRRNEEAPSFKQDGVVIATNSR